MLIDALKKVPLKRVLLEIVSVVFAVLLALGVNEWRKNLENEHLSHRALENIVLEIEANKSDIVNGLAEHKRLNAYLDSTLKAYKGAPKENAITVKKSFRFSYEHSVLNNTAWNSAQITQAVKFMDYETIAALSTIYELQAIYKDHGKEVIAAMGKVTFHEAEFKPFLKANIFNVRISINIEESLVEAYDAFLAEKEVGSDSL